ncbi:winged helix-turn-helix domain-containing protein [Kribbella jiaozuonensis]|uniref:Winged helix-turn-helix domain-containing protein n=1 Tax=Kribbella jiaozuonensis TaxID=2575441 RepID=A0A4U3M1L9_9ACTN|nr:crosslink repair DNA glycosylase YcaQ family protein [Kribbella jiaozuonensis]TKK81879.1 winged helix-turn-helix domain-containing protein [Kribbella jiaozuonensis]
MAAVGDEVSVEVARRLALGAQGFGVGRPKRVDVRKAIRAAGVLQLDSVNVLTRSHYLPVFARVGNYLRATLDKLAWGSDRELFEYFWGHKAALIPLTAYPLMRWRMRAAERQVWDEELSPDVTAPWSVVAGMRRLSAERPGYVDQVLQTITEKGPLTAGEASPDGVRRKRTDPDPDPTTGRMWNWQDAKIAIEFLFCTGQVTIAGRRHFERIYDLTERVLPADVLNAPEPTADEARRELVRIAARGLGVGTLKELCGGSGQAHFPLPAATGREVIGELVESGELIPVRVESVKQQSYRWHEAKDRPIDTQALLSPFDPLIWNRDRTHHLFDFFYRISIYTPAPQRVHGYYVLPFLLGDRLVARVDLKADRQTSTLVVPTLTAEPAAPDFIEPLAAELHLMADWLSLEHIAVPAAGRLAAQLTDRMRVTSTPARTVTADAKR